jgi:PAS domain S-box-containing protein
MDMKDSAETHSEDQNPLGELVADSSENPGSPPEDLPDRHEEYLNILLKQAFGFIVILNADMSIRYISPSVKRLSGFEPEELRGTNAMELLDPDEVEELVKVFNEGIKVPDKVEHIECRLRKKDGSWSVIEAIGSNLLDNPLIRGVLLNVHDITKSRQIEQELRKSEEQWRYLVEHLNPIVFTVDVDGCITYVSPAVESSSGLKADDLVGHVFADFVHPDDLQIVLESFRRVMEGHVTTCEFRAKDMGGKLRYLQTLSRPILEEGEVRGLLGTMSEITLRIEAQEAKRRNQEQFKALIRRQIRYGHAQE